MAWDGSTHIGTSRADQSRTDKTRPGRYRSLSLARKGEQVGKTEVGGRRGVGRREVGGEDREETERREGGG